MRKKAKLARAMWVKVVETGDTPELLAATLVLVKRFANSEVVKFCGIFYALLYDEGEEDEGTHSFFAYFQFNTPELGSQFTMVAIELEEVINEDDVFLDSLEETLAFVVESAENGS